jgi:hypothetical protein
MDNLQIKLAVTVSDGSFESSISFPVSSSSYQIAELTEGWLSMMRGALSLYKEKPPEDYFTRVEKEKT